MEKVRDILALFIVDDEEMTKFRRNLAYPGLSMEEARKLFDEYLPRVRKSEHLPLSDHYIRQHANLGSRETKYYIEGCLSHGVLTRNDEGSLEITDKGEEWLKGIQGVLNLDFTKAIFEMRRSPWTHNTQMQLSIYAIMTNHIRL